MTKNPTTTPPDFTEQARQLVKECKLEARWGSFGYDVRELESRIASALAEAATQGQATGIERAAEICHEILEAARKNREIMLRQQPPPVIPVTELNGAVIAARECVEAVRTLSPDPCYLNRVRKEAATAALEQAGLENALHFLSVCPNCGAKTEDMRDGLPDLHCPKCGWTAVVVTEHSSQED